MKGPIQDSAVNLVKSAKQKGKILLRAGCVPTVDGNLAGGLEGVSMLSVTRLEQKLPSLDRQRLEGTNLWKSYP